MSQPIPGGLVITPVFTRFRGVICGMIRMPRFFTGHPVLWALVLASAGIRVFSSDPLRVEELYSSRFYPSLSRFMRGLTGFFPVSLGDIFYGYLLLLLLLFSLRLLSKLRREGWKLFFVGRAWTRSGALLAGAYVAFNMAWGLNYDRLGIAHQLRLSVAESDTSGIGGLADELRVLTNRWSAASERLRSTATSELMHRTLRAYEGVEQIHPFLAYRPSSVKTSLFGSVGNHIGYTGYYNPFTAEAQLNDAIPQVLKPFVLCHEVAHQLGYARESEANFVGFLAARASEDSLIQYSAYFDMFLYANGALYAIDSIRARRNLSLLDTAVRRDIAELRAFRLKYQGLMERIIDVVYDRYLRMNRQPQGRASYSQVVQWLLAYRRQNGSL